MPYYGAKELASAFRTVRKNTIVIANEIPEEKYSFRAAPETRSVAELLIHIAVTPRLGLQIHQVEKRTTLEGFDFFDYFGGLIGEEKAPRTKAQIIDLLTKEGEKFASWLDTLTDQFLGDTITYPAGMTPPTKLRVEMIMSAKEHEMHHRGQLMLIERLIGITPHFTRQMTAMLAEMQKAKAGA